MVDFYKALEARRTGTLAIIEELRADKELMRKLEELVLEEGEDLSKIELYLEANAKTIWHERNPK